MPDCAVGVIYPLICADRDAVRGKCDRFTGTKQRIKVRSGDSAAIRSVVIFMAQQGEKLLLLRLIQIHRATKHLLNNPC